MGPALRAAHRSSLSMACVPAGTSDICKHSSHVTQLFPLFMITRIFFADRVLHRKQAVAILYSLDSRLAVIIPFPFGDCVNKILTYMRPVGTAFDIRQTIIALVAICFQISVKAVQEFPCMIPASGRGIPIQNDRRTTILTAPEQPHE